MLTMMLASAVAGLATTVGAAAVLAFGVIGRRTLALLLGFAAGVMVTVVFLDLFPSAYRWGGIWACLFGLIEGVLVLAVVDSLLSQWTLRTERGRRAGAMRKMGYLIALGIALHDFPEGVAIAAGSVCAESLGWTVALAIGLHNVPEGIATAAPLVMSGLAKWKVLLLTLGMACFTPMGTMLGFGLLSISPVLMAQLLALAGGAMLYIVWDELWPEAFKSNRWFAIVGAFCGFGFMLLAGH